MTRGPRTTVLLALAILVSGCDGTVTTILSQVGEPTVAGQPEPSCGSLDPGICKDAVAIAQGAIGGDRPLTAIVADSACPPNARCTEDVGIVVVFQAVGGSTAAVELAWADDGGVGAVTDIDLGPDAEIPPHVEAQLPS
jgi:hypothetical protein